MVSKLEDPKMRGDVVDEIAVIGLGYVGITTAVGLASIGHRVIGIDIDPRKIESLSGGVCPIFEEGMEELLRNGLDAGSLRFSNDFSDLSPKCSFIFLCVPTPSTSSGKADLTFLNGAVELVSQHLEAGATLIVKSTVPIGTCASLAERIEATGNKFEIASNPEFLAEGQAIRDFLSPSRIVIGARTPEVSESVIALFSQIDCPKFTCSWESAETIKHGSNAFLAVKLSFVNELAAVCEKSGANIGDVTRGLGLDPRIGNQFLKPGPGWGGSCFPKDSAELSMRARELGTPMFTVEAAIASNSNSLARTSENLMDLMGGTFVGKTLGVWGMAFKANTDDWRDSPSIEIIREAISQGARVNAYDPMTKGPSLPGLTSVDSPLDAARGANVLAVLTEWPEFSNIDPLQIREVMAAESAVFDARRILAVENWRSQFARFMVIGQT
jgi:UDPglucose 6-dehydrogenase